MKTEYVPFDRMLYFVVGLVTGFVAANADKIVTILVSLFISQVA